MTSRVFIPQVTQRYNAEAGKMVPAFDFSAAALHGPIYTVLEPTDNTLLLSRLIPKIRKGLEDFRPDDFLVAVGDPGVIAVCSALIMRRQQAMKLLKWDRRMTAYLIMEIKL